MVVVGQLPPASLALPKYDDKGWEEKAGRERKEINEQNRWLHTCILF